MLVVSMLVVSVLVDSKLVVNMLVITMLSILLHVKSEYKRSPAIVQSVPEIGRYSWTEFDRMEFVNERKQRNRDHTTISVRE